MQQGIGRKIVIAVGMLVVAGLLIVLYQWGNAREDTSKDRQPADGQTTYSFAMGTSVSVSLYGTQDTEYAKIEQAIKDLDEQEISWRQEGSALYKLNHTYTAGEAAEVSDTLYLALTQAYNICRDSQGALDITIRPLANLWNIESATEKDFRVPTDTEIKTCLLYTSPSPRD